jgi:hypothetical protein
MNGEELYNQYTSKRDYSGSKADEYAQLLETIRFHIGKAVYSLLETAEADNKQLNLKDEGVLVDEYSIDDVIFL